MLKQRLPQLARLKPLIVPIVAILLGSCSTIAQKDCSRNMQEFGLEHGKAGLPKNYLDEIRQTCLGKFPNIDLEAYQKGFEQGWALYCTPIKGFEMGKKADSYISFCPIEREKSFREKYLLGMRHFELKDIQEETAKKLEDLQSKINNDAIAYSEYIKTKNELENIGREIQTIEVEGMSAPSNVGPLINSKERKL